MKIIFDNADEYDALHGAVHDAILYWTKVRQDAQGKICLQCDGSKTHYDEKYAVDQMVLYGCVLETLERTPHPEWNDVTSVYELVTDEDGSAMVNKIKKMIPTMEES